MNNLLTVEGLGFQLVKPPGRALPVVDGALEGSGRIKAAGDLELDKKQGYVYVVSLTDSAIPRASGALSTVLYVGRGTGSRVGHLATGGHSACGALARLYWALRPGEGDLPVRVSVFLVDHPGLSECLALNVVAHRTGELPPANCRWEHWLAKKVLEYLAEKACSAEWTWTAAYNWPAQGKGQSPPQSVSTIVDFHAASASRTQPGRYLGSLVWIWHEDWLPASEPDRRFMRIAEHAGSLLLVEDSRSSDKATGILSDLGSKKDWQGCRIVGPSFNARGLYGMNERDAQEVLRALLDGQPSRSGTPIEVLRDWLEGARTAAGSPA